MSYRKLSAEQLNSWLDQLARDYRLVAPSRDEEGVVLFKTVTGAAQVAADYTKSVVSPKGEFLPQTEKIFEFDTAGQGVELTPPDGPGPTSVLFGVRPCDLRSIALLDPVFSGQFQDGQYAQRRQNNLVVGLACQEVQSTCFCHSFGISPIDGSGADIMLTRDDDSYYAEVLTPRGEVLAAKYQDLCTAGDASTIENHKKVLLAKLEQSFVRHPDPKAIKQLLDDNFDLPYWETLAARCLGCGICTYVCPTCHCFDIFDHTAGGSKGKRFRCWDSCMYSDFTMMAGGHNPRPGKMERVRNRFMHKLKYHLDRYGVEGCVGCGRCIQKCPVNIDIAKIIDDLKEMV